jgi:acyl dehydratase
LSHTSIAEAQVGDSLPEVTFGPVQRTTLARYAGASGDYNPIHIDIDFARDAGLRDVFAHGMLSMAQIGRVVTDWAGIARVRSIGVRFAALTQIGDVLSCKGQIVERFNFDGVTLLRIELSALIQNGDTTVVGEAEVRVWRGA